MIIGSRSVRHLLLLYALSPMTRLLAQQYCASGTVSESHTNDLKVGDPIILTAQVESGTQSCTAASDRTECTAVVQLEIQSGSRRWSGAALQSKAASIAFTFFSRDTTTRIVLGGVVAPASPPQALSPFNVFGVHLDFGTYSGNRLANGGLPPTIPSVSDRPFEPPSFTLTGPGGNTVISYTGQDCGSVCPTQPAAGDVVAYFAPDDVDQKGPIFHVAVIDRDGVSRDGTGTVTWIVSKWGDYGVYRSDPDDTIYGKNWAAFHTRRSKGNVVIQEGQSLFTDKHHPIDIIGPDGAVFTKDQADKEIEKRCNGLSRYITVQNNPVEKWPGFDCRGYVFFHGLVRIPLEETLLGVHDFVRDILQDNEYCKVPSKPTGGHGCSILNTRLLEMKGESRQQAVPKGK